MSSDDLVDLHEIDEKQRAVLAEKLSITTCYELIMADRRDVLRAFGRRKYKPTLEEIGDWQDAARRRYLETNTATASAIADPGWEQAGIFVVAFERRRVSGQLEQQLVAEQTEVEPDAAPHQRAQWNSWACGELCRWMLERAEEEQPASTPPTGPDADGDSDATDASPPDVVEDSAIAPVPQVVVVRASLEDASGDTMLVRAARPVGDPSGIWIRPVRLRIDLDPAAGSGVTKVVLQMARPGHRKEFVTGRVLDGRTAEIDLSNVPAGAYEPTIVVSAPDGSARPSLVKLGMVEIVK